MNVEFLAVAEEELAQAALYYEAQQGLSRRALPGCCAGYTYTDLGITLLFATATSPVSFASLPVGV